MLTGHANIRWIDVPISHTHFWTTVHPSGMHLGRIPPFVPWVENCLSFWNWHRANGVIHLVWIWGAFLHSCFWLKVALLSETSIELTAWKLNTSRGWCSCDKLMFQSKRSCRAWIHCWSEEPLPLPSTLKDGDIRQWKCTSAKDSIIEYREMHLCPEDVWHEQDNQQISRVAYFLVLFFCRCEERSVCNAIIYRLLDIIKSHVSEWRL